MPASSAVEVYALFPMGIRLRLWMMGRRWKGKGEWTWLEPLQSKVSHSMDK
jgi:hypothetical protein